MSARKRTQQWSPGQHPLRRKKSKVTQLKENSSLASPFCSRPCSPTKRVLADTHFNPNIPISQSTTSSPTKQCIQYRRPSAPTSARPENIIPWSWNISKPSESQHVNFDRPPSQLDFFDNEAPPVLHPIDIDLNLPFDPAFFDEARAVSTPTRSLPTVASGYCTPPPQPYDLLQHRSALDTDSDSSTSSDDAEVDKDTNEDDIEDRFISWQTDSIISPPTACLKRAYRQRNQVTEDPKASTPELDNDFANLEVTPAQPLSPPAEIPFQPRPRRGTIGPSDVLAPARRTRSGTLVAAVPPTRRTRSGTITGPPAPSVDKQANEADERGTSGMPTTSESQPTCAKHEESEDELDLLRRPWVDGEDDKPWSCAEPPSPEVKHPSFLTYRAPRGVISYGKHGRWARRRAPPLWNINIEQRPGIEEEGENHNSDDELLLRPGQSWK